jgi:hypothetical protein
LKRSLQKHGILVTTWTKKSDSSRVARFVKQDEVKKLSDQVVAEIVKLFKEKTNQQLKLLNLFMSYGGINSKN